MKPNLMALIAAIVCLGASLGVSAGGSSTIGGVPNPAAQICINDGGRLLGVQTPEGAMGFCEFGSAMIERWTYFRSRRGEKCMAVAALLDPSDRRNGAEKPESAASWCRRAGGKTHSWLKSEPRPLATCVFGDHSSIEAETLMRGPRDSRNAQLVNLLKK